MKRGHHAGRDGIRQPKRVTDRHHRLAGHQIPGRTELHGRELHALSAHLQNREIEVRIRADHIALEGAAIGQGDRHVRSPRDDVLVRQHETCGVDEHP